MNTEDNGRDNLFWIYPLDDLHTIHNVPSKNDIIDKFHHTDNDGDTYMIKTNNSQRFKVHSADIRNVISVPN